MTLGRKVGHQKRQKKKLTFSFLFTYPQIKYTFEKSDFLIIKCKDYDRLYQIKRHFFFWRKIDAPSDRASLYVKVVQNEIPYISLFSKFLYDKN